MAGQNVLVGLTLQVILSYPGCASLTPLALNSLACQCKHGWCEHVADDHSTSPPALGGRELQISHPGK